MRHLLLSLIGFAMIGCSSGEPPNSTTEAPAVPNAKSADAAVRQVIDELRQGHAQALWHFLPPSFQSDLQQAVRDVASKIDEKDWKRFAAVGRKARRVLADKKSALLNFAVHVDRPAESALVINIEPLVRILSILEQSDLSDLQRMRTMEAGQFLKTFGDEFVMSLAELYVEVPSSRAGIVVGQASPNNPFAALAQVDVTLKSSSSDQAVVEFRWAENAVQTFDFVRVEKHWLPKTLVDGWASGLASARETGFVWADGLHQNSDAWEDKLAAIDQWLDELAETKTDDEARQIWHRGLTATLLAVVIEAPPVQGESPPQAVPSSQPTRPKIADTEELLPDRPLKP